MENKPVQNIKSAFNYTGGKYKLLPQIQPLFPEDNSYKRFVDLFAGGGSVAINIHSSKQIIINDLEANVIKFMKLLKKKSIELIVVEIESLIDKYRLSNTKKYGYNYYNADSSTGLGKVNKEGYTQLRNDFNNEEFHGDLRSIVFYILTVYCFNNQIRYNSKGFFNLPVGKRDFNKNMLNKLIAFHTAINEKDIEFTSLDFRDFQFEETDFIYVDPPYRIATASYNENGGWGLKDDLDLFELLDLADSNGMKFAFSNVVKHMGRTNDELIDWSKKYETNLLEFNYNNSNYQTKSKLNETVEILITNYKK